ncbi:MAG: acyltransferase [Caulobacteraceae bacterium]
MEQQNIRPLTTMRIFAAFWVVLYDYWAFLIPGPLPAFIAKGYLGVELFFVLSGFIICHVYLQKFGEGRFSYRSFLWARLARIYPLHIAILAGLIVLVLGAAAEGLTLSGGMAQWGSIPGQVLMLQAWGFTPEGGWNHPAWSISAEWFAYVTFPLTAWVAWRLRNRPGLALGLAAVAVVAFNLIYGWATGGELTRATITGGAIRIVPCFLLGSAVYLVWKARPLASRRAAELLTLGTVAAAAAATVLDAPDFLTVLIFGALIYALAALTTAGSAWLTHKAGVYLGEVSFAVYMVCIPYQLIFMQAAKRVFGVGDVLPLPLWLALVGGVIPAAMLLHHAVERPARDIMRRWERNGLLRPAWLPAKAAG